MMRDIVTFVVGVPDNGVGDGYRNVYEQVMGYLSKDEYSQMKSLLATVRFTLRQLGVHIAVTLEKPEELTGDLADEAWELTHDDNQYLIQDTPIEPACDCG